MSATIPTGKADFGDIYVQSDASAYYRVLGELDYRIPQHGATLFEPLVKQRDQAASGQVPTVLDVCCSYGVGGMLLKTDLDLDDLYEHYRETDAQGLHGSDLAAADRQLLDEHRQPSAPRMIGLDVSHPAIDYAVSTGALDDGAVEDLEANTPSDRLAGLLADVDMITSTGGVGYVTDKTFSQVLDLAEQRRPWVAAFCLRTYDYEPIAEVLAGHGLVTERSSRTYSQRRFASEAEREWALSQVTGRGLDPAGKEADGSYHAEFFLSRPADEVATRSLSDLLPGLV